MISIERILCPATLPPEADKGLSYAVSLARAYKADLFLCHCTSARPALTAAAGAGYDQIRKALAHLLARYNG